MWHQRHQYLIVLARQLYTGGVEGESSGEGGPTIPKGMALAVFGALSRPFWGHFGTILGSFWAPFGSLSESFWALWVIPGYFWGHFGTIFPLFWIILGAFDTILRTNVGG